MVMVMDDLCNDSLCSLLATFSPDCEALQEDCCYSAHLVRERPSLGSVWPVKLKLPSSVSVHRP